MTNKERTNLYKIYRKFLYDVGGLKQSMDSVGVVKKSINFIEYLGLKQGVLKKEEDRWFVGFFQEIAWFIFENPLDQKEQEMDDGRYYTWSQFIEKQINVYSEKSYINEWIK
jgi:hypothetical protein